MHGLAKEFKGHDAFEMRLFVDNKAGFGDDAVSAFFLHTRQTAKRLIGHVLAKAGQPNVVALKLNAAQDATQAVFDVKDRCFLRQNLVARMILAFDHNDFACGGDHLPPEKIVERCAVFKGAGAAGVLRNIAADGRGLLGSRINGKECACLVHGRNGRLGNHPALAGHGHGFKINGANMGQTRHGTDNGASAGGNSAAGHTRTTAARDNGKF